MKIIRKLFSMATAFLSFCFIIILCVNLYMYVSDKYDLNSPNVGADVSHTKVEEVNTKTGTTTKIYIETTVINDVGLEVPGYVVKEYYTETENDDSAETAIVDTKKDDIILNEDATSKPEDKANGESIVVHEVNGKILSDEEGCAQAKILCEKYAETADKFIIMLNEYRAQNNVYPLELDKKLCQIAAHRSVENATANWFVIAKIDGYTRHIRPNGNIASSIADYYGLGGCYSENMGRFQRNLDEIFTGWQKSEAHNALLLSTANTKVGLGVATDSNGFYYWTAIFN